MLGLNQSELAKLADCSPRTIQAVELGPLNLSDGLALKIAQSTGVSVEWLLNGDPAEPPMADSPAAIQGPFTEEIFHAHRAFLEIERDAAVNGRENTTEQLFAADLHAEALKKQDDRLLVLCRRLLEDTRTDERGPVIRWRLRRMFEQLTADVDKNREAKAHKERSKRRRFARSA